MGKVFNSGLGGYTCDNCSTLLWTGVDKKKFIYTIELIDIIEHLDFFYCSKKCLKESNSTFKEPVE